MRNLRTSGLTNTIATRLSMLWRRRLEAHQPEDDGSNLFICHKHECSCEDSLEQLGLHAFVEGTHSLMPEIQPTNWFKYQPWTEGWCLSCLSCCNELERVYVKIRWNSHSWEHQNDFFAETGQTKNWKHKETECPRLCWGYLTHYIWSRICLKTSLS